jgi:16S rRNA (cytidine1402-2'-O)-methyltransferase
VAAKGGGALYVVATPIGNLGDISLRALEVLRAVAVVAAEDTRVTRKIWSRFEIGTPLVSYHAHSSDRRTAELIERLEAGDDVALVTDAGTPLVSDPGAILVSAWIERGGTVVPVPGASAVLAALVASGLPAARWGFEGFLPRKGRERKERLARIAADDRATVLYESHGRTAATLRDLATVCGPARSAVVARELTKVHEEFRRGSLSQLADGAEAMPAKGEVVIIVAGAPADAASGVSLEAGRARVERLVAEGLKRSTAARQVAQETGLPRRELFAADD